MLLGLIKAIERNSGQRFNEGIMAKPPMSADDMVVGPTAILLS